MSDPIQCALDRFDEANARDPHLHEVDGISVPRELFFAQRLSEWVNRLHPAAPDALRLAARCQHLCRWEIPRDRYPMNRAGYLKWRSDLKQYHADQSSRILRECGCHDGLIQEVVDLNLKKNLARDPLCQTLEDALCLVFLENQFESFVEKYPEEKVISVLQKTWKKMSSQGHTQALKLHFSSRSQALIQRAIAT